MTHDFNKPPHVTSSEEVKQKKRIPVYILLIVGIFLASLIFYMVSDKPPKEGSVSSDNPVPAVQTTHSTAQETTVDHTDRDMINAVGQ